MNVKEFGKGAIIQPTAFRDFRLEIASAILLPSQFSLKNKVGIIKNQNGSSSCVAQAFSAYAELLNNVETNQSVQLSARDIYSDIYLPQGGAYLKDAAVKITQTGVIPEKEASSYLSDGTPPTESYMRNRSDITGQAQDDGMTYIAKSYVTWNNTNIDLYKQAIVQGNGAVVACAGTNYCWQNAEIQIPQITDWSHAVLLVGYDDSKKQFTFLNSWGGSWGDGGFGYLPYEYVTKGLVSNPMTLIDYPNTQYMLWISLIQNLKDKIAKLLNKKI